MEESLTVIKLGGSLVLPKKGPTIDFGFLYSLKEILKKHASNGHKFFLVVGGGKVCRDMQNAARKGGIKDETSLNRIGIAGTNIGAEMVHSVFKDLASPEIIRYEKYFDPEITNLKGKIIIGCGALPKYSTDTCAVILAEKFRAKRIVSLKDVDGVYSEDPKKNSKAKPLKFISWDKYLEIINSPDRHLPGANLPIDVVAAKRAKKKDIDFYVLAGKKLGEFEKVMTGKPFSGTKISG